MPDIDITKDVANATLVITTVFTAPPEQVWQLWADPRRLERWWGPDPYPATVVEHDLRPGGRVTYYMTSPEGDRHPGYWQVLETEAPHRLVLEDGFADDSGEPDRELPVSRTEVAIEAIDPAHTRMTLTSVYDTAAALEEVLAMGMEQGITIALEQSHALLAQDHAAGR